MDSWVLTVLALTILTTGCRGFQGQVRPGSVPVTDWSTSGTSPLPLPPGAASPYLAPQMAPIVQHAPQNTGVLSQSFTNPAISTSQQPTSLQTAITPGQTVMSVPQQPTAIQAAISSRQTVMPTSQQPTAIQAAISSRQTVMPTSQQPTAIQAAISSRQTVMPTSQQPTAIQAAISSRQTVMPTSQQPTAIQAAISSRQTVMPTSQQPTAMQTVINSRQTVMPASQQPTATQTSTSSRQTIMSASQQPTTRQAALGSRQTAVPAFQQPTAIQAAINSRQTAMPLRTKGPAKNLPLGGASPYPTSHSSQLPTSLVKTFHKSPFKLFLSQFQPSLTSKPVSSPLNLWRSQNRQYMSQLTSARAAWKARTMALTAAIGRLQMRLRDMSKRREQEEQRKRTIMPRIQKLINFYTMKDTANVIGLADAVGDLDCEYVPSRYPGSCDDDQCPAGKECRVVSGMGLCCPPSVTSDLIKRKANYDY